MGSVPAKAFVLIQLSVLLLSCCFNVFGDEVDIVSWAQPPHHHLPAYPPADSPISIGDQPPPPGDHHHHKGQPPKTSPAHPPSYRPVRKPIAVQGVVLCKSCKYPGVDTLLGASPILGAVVKLRCYNTKYRIEKVAITDKNGFFFIMAPKTISTFGFHKCKVFIVSSPLATCNKPTNLHGGRKGATLRRLKLPPAPHRLPFELFSAGPFAFQSSAKIKCPP